MNTQTQKKIIAVSKAFYRGITIYETPRGTATFYIGWHSYEVADLARATAFIDDWFKERES